MLGIKRRNATSALISMGLLALPLAFACPDAHVCSPVGSSTTGGTHDYDLGTDAILDVVYDQCATHSPFNALLDNNEWAAGINGAVYPSVALKSNFGGTNNGGTKNCLGPLFDGHHGSDTTINTRDAVQGGNVRVYITATYSGSSQDPCGSNDIGGGGSNLFIEVGPCGPLACSTSWYNVATGASSAPGSPPPMGLPAVHNTLADISGLDGAVWVFYSISTGNASVPTSGISWTSR